MKPTGMVANLEESVFRTLYLTFGRLSLKNTKTKLTNEYTKKLFVTFVIPPGEQL